MTLEHLARPGTVLVLLVVAVATLSADDSHYQFLDFDKLLALNLTIVDDRGNVRLKDSPTVEIFLTQLINTPGPKYGQEEIDRELIAIYNTISKDIPRRTKRSTNFKLAILATIAPSIFGPNNPGTLALQSFIDLNNGINIFNIPMTIFTRIIRLILTTVVNIFELGNSGINWGFGLASAAITLASGLVSAVAGIISGGIILTVRNIFTVLRTIPAIVETAISLFRRIIKILNFLTIDIPNSSVHFIMQIMNSMASSNRFLTTLFFRQIKSLLTLPFRILQSAPSLLPTPAPPGLMSLFSKAFTPQTKTPDPSNSALGALAIPSALLLINLPLLTSLVSNKTRQNDEKPSSDDLVVPDFSLYQSKDSDSESLTSALSRTVKHIRAGIEDIANQLTGGSVSSDRKSPASIISEMGKSLLRVKRQPLISSLLTGLILTNAVDADPSTVKKLVSRRLIEDPLVIDQLGLSQDFTRTIRDLNESQITTEEAVHGDLNLKFGDSGIPLEVFHNNSKNEEFSGIPAINFEDIISHPESPPRGNRISSLNDLTDAFKEIIRVESYLEAFPDANRASKQDKNIRLFEIIGRALGGIQQKDNDLLGSFIRSNLTNLLPLATKVGTAANLDQLLSGLNPFNGGINNILGAFKNNSQLTQLFSATPGMGLFDNLRALIPRINPLQALGLTSLILLQAILTMPFVGAGIATARIGGAILNPNPLLPVPRLPTIVDIIAPQPSILNPLSFINPLSMLRAHVQKHNPLERIRDLFNPFRIIMRGFDLTPFGGIFRGLQRLIKDPLEMAGIATFIGFSLFATAIGVITSIVSIGGVLARGQSNPLPLLPLFNNGVNNTELGNFMKLNFGGLFQPPANSTKNPIEVINNLRTLLREHPILTSILVIKGFFLPAPLNFLGLLGLLSIVLLGGQNKPIPPLFQLGNNTLFNEFPNNLNIATLLQKISNHTAEKQLFQLGNNTLFNGFPNNLNIATLLQKISNHTAEKQLLQLRNNNLFNEFPNNLNITTFLQKISNHTAEKQRRVTTNHRQQMENFITVLKRLQGMNSTTVQPQTSSPSPISTENFLVPKGTTISPSPVSTTGPTPVSTKATTRPHLVSTTGDVKITDNTRILSSKPIIVSTAIVSSYTYDQL